MIARAIAAVLYGHAIHALREEYGDSTITVKEAGELQEQVTKLSCELSETRTSFQELSSELASVRENLHRQFSSELSPIRVSFQEQLAPLHESLECHQATLASLPALQAQVRHLASSLTPEAHKRPLLRALPSREQQETHVSRTAEPVVEAMGTAGKFDARAFVFACLSENPALKLSEIEQRARTSGQELSQPTASRYRKQFFSQNESSGESSSVKAESSHESSTVKVQDMDENSPADERKIVGE